MTTIIHTFATPGEAMAFLGGLEFANDADALEGNFGPGACDVTTHDQDGEIEDNCRRDYTKPHGACPWTESPLE